MDTALSQTTPCTYFLQITNCTYTCESIELCSISKDEMREGETIERDREGGREGERERERERERESNACMHARKVNRQSMQAQPEAAVVH